MTDISQLLLTGSARAIGAAISAGTLTSREATAWYLARIERFNGGATGLNCVRSVSPRAFEEADRADAERASGRVRGPLHGVPYLLKDNVFSADGTCASAGSKALEDYLPPYDATLVIRLRGAGAVLLGKTNLTEFADFVSDVMPSEYSGAGGIVRNPLGIRYDRGQGSSVGSASAVGARFCGFAIGSETQNSIQTPATFTSIVGFKPTVGQVSRHGVIPLVPSQDSPGVLALTVDDAALVYEAMAGADMRDSATLARLADFKFAQIAGASVAGMRIGVPRRFIADNVLGDDNREAFDRVLSSLAQAGATIVDPCDLPSAEQLHEVRSCVFRTEFKESLNEMLGSLRPRGLTSMAELIHWNRSNPQAIPYGQSLLEAAEATEGITSAQYVADRRRDQMLSISAGIDAAMDNAQVDVLLAPMTAAAKCTGKAGAPVAAVPAGKDAAGSPFGITLFASPGQDRSVLRAARAVEQVVGERIEATLG